MSACLLAVDPGVTTGCCLFKNGVPLRCFTLRKVTWKDSFNLIEIGLAPTLRYPYPTIFEAICEVPDTWVRTSREKPKGQTVERKDKKPKRAVNIKSLMMVWSIAYAIVGAWHQKFGLSHVVTVSEWKGSRSKRSTSEEAALILKAEGVDVTLAKNEHERDALALGLWWLRHGKERELQCSR